MVNRQHFDELKTFHFKMSDLTKQVWFDTIDTYKTVNKSSVSRFCSMKLHSRVNNNRVVVVKESIKLLRSDVALERKDTLRHVSVCT